MDTFPASPEDSVPFDVESTEVDVTSLDFDAMDRASAIESTDSVAETGTEDPFDFAERNSRPFIGRWNRLVSRTNWDKGRIISEWRDSLVEAGAPATAYSDEAWSRLVGGVTSQHVGRLRRVHQRFGLVYESYEGLYWTHFQAALDWNDAEMWLEGASRDGWSVSELKRRRAETLGTLSAGDALEEPAAAEYDEVDVAIEEESGSKFDEASAGPRSEPPDFGEDPQYLDDADDSEGSIVEAIGDEDGAEIADPGAPAFEHLGSLPDDLAEALEAFQVAIIRHRREGWTEVDPATVIEALAGLRRLVEAGEN